MRSLTIAAVVLAFAGAEAASAATLRGKLHKDPIADDSLTGTLRYRAASGTDNSVRITPVGRQGEFRVTDRTERLRVRGTCDRVSAHAAECPPLEFAVIIVAVRDGADTVVRKGCGARRLRDRVCVNARVKGGRGDDLLRGGGDLFGGPGDDRLRGNRLTFDRFHGGPGRDHMRALARRSNVPHDTFFDDETDAQAARDTIIAGKNARSRIDYSHRDRDLKIDLRRDRIGPEHDRVQGIRSVVTGSGDDVIRGTGGDNTLAGGPGDDLLMGAGASDDLSGGAGDDRIRGGNGNDFVSESTSLAADGAGGSDLVDAGPGADTVTVNDAEEGGTPSPDEVRCDDEDTAPVGSDPLDELPGCELISGWSSTGGLELRIQPELTDDSAIFTLRCGATESEIDPDDGTATSRCRGQLIMRAPGGTEFGRQAFEFDAPPLGPGTETRTVEVPLTAEGREAIRTGTDVEVEALARSASGWRFFPAGYRAFMQG